MLRIQSFAPIAASNAKILILGSMPGVASLRVGEYYAHPRNLFWRIMGALIPLQSESPYEQRVQALQHAHIALWDVLHSCTRSGSLDANIDKTTQIPNDFQNFLALHASITHVFFNGAAADQAYRKLILPSLTSTHIHYQRLPSTSPAHASLSYESKLAAWQALRAAC
jgi:double-stranded uracil-DNA glycosylase